MKISLCLLTWNELEGCKIDVPEIPRQEFQEIFCIDAGSTDGTIEYLKKQKIKIYLQSTKGLNAACIYALQQCKTDAIVFFHPKGTIPTSDLKNFRKFFENGYGFVVGSRNMKGGKNEEDSSFFWRPRKWFTTLCACTLSILWRREGNIIGDVLHGFRGLTREAFEYMFLKKQGLTIDLEMVVNSYKKKIKRIEFPTQEKDRPFGETHFKAIPTGCRLIKYILCELFCRKSHIKK